MQQILEIGTMHQILEIGTMQQILEIGTMQGASCSFVSKIGNWGKRERKLSWEISLFIQLSHFPIFCNTSRRQNQRDLRVPINMHCKTLKWDFLQNSSIELAEIENM